DRSRIAVSEGVASEEDWPDKSDKPEVGGCWRRRFARPIIIRFDSLTSRSLSLWPSRLCRGFPNGSILDCASLPWTGHARLECKDVERQRSDCRISQLNLHHPRHPRDSWFRIGLSGVQKTLVKTYKKSLQSLGT